MLIGELLEFTLFRAVHHCFFHPS